MERLQSLVDKSLVRVREGARFWMLETIREFAREQLEEAGEAEATRARHAGFFASLAEAAGLAAEAEGEQRHGIVVADEDNVRRRDGARSRAPRGGVCPRARGGRREGDGDPAAPARRDGAHRRRPQRGKTLLEESFELSRAVEFAKGEAQALGSLGQLEVDAGHHEVAVGLLDRANTLSRELGLRWFEAGWLSSLSEVAVALGRLDEATRFGREALAIAAALGDRQISGCDHVRGEGRLLAGADAVAYALSE